MARKRPSEKQHRWLSQVEVTGVVFSEPVLAEAEPAGFPSLDKQTLARFYKAREIWNLPKGMVENDGQDQWIQFVLRGILRLEPRDWLVGSAIPSSLVVNLPLQQETLRPTRVIVDEGKPILLMLEVPREQSLDRPWVQGNGKWKASPTTKLERLLRESGVELGLVTNGETWRLLVASPSETASWLTWTANSWADSPLTLAAFRDLLGQERFFAGDREKVALELIKKSRVRQLDVADQLGSQVIEALSLIVRELDRSDAESEHPILEGYTEAQIFEAGVAYVMRLVFVLYAEENGLLPHGSTAYDRSYGILHLLTELENQHRIEPDKLGHSYSGYSRALATARLIHAGSVDPDIRVAAHGGTLFDPNHLPMLEGRRADGSWPSERRESPRVRDAVLREILRSLKYAKSDGSRQLVSYRTLAVEQIGHMYQGLLDRCVVRAPENQAIIFLQGSSKIPSPEPVFAREIADKNGEDLVEFVSKHTGRTKRSLKALLERPQEQIRTPGGRFDFEALLAPADPIRMLLVDRGIVRPGGLYVWFGSSRRSQGTHYTPPALTEPIVRSTLQPLLEALGNKPTPRDLLDLKICDPAMGSGAFLVQVVRQLSLHLVECWEAASMSTSGQRLTMPFCEPSKGSQDEALLPESREERLVWARRYVAELCIYGVDCNRHAVEMAKVSLWIATLSSDRPFTFLDHALKNGDALVGMSKRQIAALHWKANAESQGGLFESGLRRGIEQALGLRSSLRENTQGRYDEKRQSWWKAEGALADARLIGDLVVAAFFDADTDKAREKLRDEYCAQIQLWQEGKADRREVERLVEKLTNGDKPIRPFHWDIEYPEVFGRNPAGFDAVVGNPPYISFYGRGSLAAHFPVGYKEFVQGQHCSIDQVAASSGRLNTFVAFSIMSTRLLQESGCITLVLPDALLTNESYEPLRRSVTASGRLMVVKRYRSSVFADASVGTAIVTWGGAARSRRVRMQDWGQAADPAPSVDVSESLVDILSRQGVSWFPIASTEMRKATLPEAGTVSLEEVALVKDGINTGSSRTRAKLLTTTGDGDPSLRPCMEGKWIRPFAIHKLDLLVRYDTAALSAADRAEGASLGRLEVFDSPKIVYRQTAPHIIAAVDLEGLCYRNSVHAIIPYDMSENKLWALCGYLNSEFFRLYYQAVTGETRTTFPQVHISSMKKMRVPVEVLDDSSAESLTLAKLARKAGQVGTSAAEAALAEINELVAGIAARLQGS